MRYVYRFEAMTTPCEVTLMTPKQHKADRCAHAILKEAKRLEKKYNYFDPDSVVSAINRRDDPMLDAETHAILKRCIAYYDRTDHIFDITVATFKETYRFAKNAQELSDQLERLRPYAGCEHITLSKQRVRFDNAHTRIDLGGFVKELAVDHAVSLVKKAKITGALINFGGDVYALGRREDGAKFRIGINDPSGSARHLHYLEIENEALTTSASNERFYTIDETTHSHILSTTSFDHDVLSVSVISESCVESGVYSTALMIDPTLKTDHRVFFVHA